MSTTNTVFFSLGSNQGDRKFLLQKAIELLNERAGNIRAVSSFYETEPWGFDSPFPFLNVALCLQTSIEPKSLLQITQQIEKELGRIRKPEQIGYTDRTIDIDMLLYANITISTPDLTLPHPLMTQRRFVLEPLCEIAPQLKHPCGKTISELLSELPND